jgi:hypothetical protein
MRVAMTGDAALSGCMDWSNPLDRVRPRAFLFRLSTARTLMIVTDPSVMFDGINV